MAIQDRGLGSPHMSASKKREIQSAGGKASRSSSARAASGTGRTFENRKKASDAGKKGGAH